MSLLIKIGVFVLFLVVYFGWLYLASTQFNRMRRGLVTGRWFLNSEISLLIRNLAFVLFIFLLTGYFSLSFTLILLAAAQIGVLLGAVLLGFIGVNLPQHTARSLWAGFETRLHHNRLMSFLETVIAIMVYIYPLVAGYVFFTHPYPSTELTLWVFRVTLLGIIFPGLPFILLATIDALLSPHLDEDTRMLSFADQASALSMNILFVALAFWAFGGAGSGNQISIGEVAIPLNSQLFAGLMVFFLIGVMLPYLMGTQRAKKWRAFLLSRRAHWLERLLDILDFPGSAAYANKLSDLQAEVSGEADRLANNDPMIARGLLTEQNPGSQEYLQEDIAAAYLNSRELDPRLNYRDWLLDLAQKINETNGDLQGKADEATRTKAAAEWAKAFRTRKAEVAETIKGIESAKPSLLVGAGVLLTPLISLVLDNLSQSVWETFLGSLLP